ncbi:hypothetical protein J7K50_02910 [bacterium]|nr:hypothetical protein [bacterium]
MIDDLLDASLTRSQLLKYAEDVAKLYGNLKSENTLLAHANAELELASQEKATIYCLLRSSE